MTAADLSRVDVPADQLAADMAALVERQRYATRPEPRLPECAHCGSQHGPWVPEPHNARYSNDAQVLVCKDRCTPADPERHDLDPADGHFATAASGFRKPATDDDASPEWRAQLAARAAECRKTRAARLAAQTNTTAGGTA